MSYYVRTYNADGYLLDSAGPYRHEHEARAFAERRRATIENSGWAFEVVVVEVPDA